MSRYKGERSQLNVRINTKLFEAIEAVRKKRELQLQKSKTIVGELSKNDFIEATFKLDPDIEREYRKRSRGGLKPGQK